jgi:aminopeptidase
MVDPRLQRLARLLVQYSAPVHEGDLVEIAGTTLAAPLLRELYRETLRAGGYPFLHIHLPDQAEIFLKTASEQQLQTISPINRLVIEEFDCQFHVMSEANTRALTAIDPQRQALQQQAQRPLIDTFLRRDAEGSLRWNVCLYPTDAYAQDAEMSREDFTAFVFNACLLDHDDPVAAWQEVQRRQQRLVDYLADKREIHIIGPDTDLRLSIAGRCFINDHGTANMPGGEIFTGPVEDSVEGTVRFSFPASFGGRSVEDVRLRFEGGRVVEASAKSNEEYLRRMLDMDEGARVLGEFAFGTNQNIQRFIRNGLFDEKIGGTIHLALGASYPETGGRNQSALHWDMVCDLRGGSEVRVDGELFAKDGQFVI